MKQYTHNIHTYILQNIENCNVKRLRHVIDNYY